MPIVLTVRIDDVIWRTQTWEGNSEVSHRLLDSDQEGSRDHIVLTLESDG